MNAVLLERTAFEIHRASEYFNSRELQAATGQPDHFFERVVLKELLDNALDAAETVGIPPRVGIAVEHDTDYLTLSVEDNGPGLPPGLLGKILDFNTRTSDKAAYRSPTRGAQGNALKTVIGIAYVREGSIVIESMGIRHDIHPNVTPAGTVEIGHERTKSPLVLGTRVTVKLRKPRIQIHHLDFAGWATGYELLNPHAQVKIRVFKQGDLASLIGHSETLGFYFEEECREFGKFRSNEPTSAHWYDFNDFQRLAYLSGTQTGIGIRDFVRQFRGLVGTAKLKAVCEGLGGALAGIVKDEPLMKELLNRMKAESRPLKPALLGVLGEDHMVRAAGLGLDRWWYKRAVGDDPMTPFVFEILVGLTPEHRNLSVHGINNSVSFEDPLRGADLEIDGDTVKGIDGALARCALGSQGHVLATHLVCPRLEFLDRGKTRLSVPEAMRGAINGAVDSALKALIKERIQRERDYSRASRRAMRQAVEFRKEATATVATMREMVFEVLPQAIEKGTGGRLPISARSLFYQVRPLLQAHTQNELDYGYFSQSLLPEYQRLHGAIPPLYYDPRGWLYEPHTGREVKLGTREVEDYSLPPHRYDKILFVEKKGLWPVLREARLAERYDMAVIASEGYASTAARALLARAQTRGDCRLFVLHDADPDGYNIARTLGEETQRMPGHSIEVVDLGLTVEEAQAMGLQSETFTRRKDLPHGLELTPAARQWFVGNKVGVGKHTQWECRRTELNAMSSQQLVDHVEDGLRRAGATRKVIAPEDKIRSEAERAARAKIAQAAGAIIWSILGLGGITEQVADEFLGTLDAPDYLGLVDRAIHENRTLTWDRAAVHLGERIVERDEARLCGQIREAVLERVRKRGI